MQFLFAGLISGVISGLGMGGGVILIVILSYLTNFNQLSLQTLNLLYYIPTALFTLYIYYKNKCVDYKIALKIILVAIIPTICAAFIANNINTNVLKKLFGICVIFVGIMIVNKAFKTKK